MKEALEALHPAIKARAVKGELDHASDAKIHLDRVSHLITRVWIEGKMVMGEAEVIRDTPCGQVLAALLENKVQVGISSRGVGDVGVVSSSTDSYDLVKPGFKIITWDVVGDPSVSEAVMHIMESREMRTHKERLGKQLAVEISNWLRGSR